MYIEAEKLPTFSFFFFFFSLWSVILKWRQTLCFYCGEGVVCDFRGVICNSVTDVFDFEQLPSFVALLLAGHRLLCVLIAGFLSLVMYCRQCPATPCGLQLCIVLRYDELCIFTLRRTLTVVHRTYTLKMDILYGDLKKKKKKYSCTVVNSIFFSRTL